MSSKYLNLADTTTYQAGVVQSAAFRSLKKFTDGCLREYGLTTMQWFILGTIYDSGDEGIRISDLSRSVDTNLPYITNTLNLLESQGAVERVESSKDGRSKRVRITYSYRPQCDIIEAALRQKMRSGIYSRIDPDQLRSYLYVLHQFTTLDKDL